ncbi:MAG: class I SAM-dependent methyltransferase [Planctomycetota bacterium]|jgi:SAM-dependent methyltransferase
MKKAYESHEIAYQQMRKQGAKQWGGKGSGTKGSFSYETKRFLKDVLSQPWAPKGGRAVDLGCGTGPILRWVCERGFSGLGLDVSKTAIAMAKEQSAGLDIRFRKADVCNLNTSRTGKFDLVVDGHCYHCITDTDDRRAYLQTACDLLKPGGVFVLMTMCGPVDREHFKRAWKGLKLHKGIVYHRWNGQPCEGMREFNGQNYAPNRMILHWQKILKELRQTELDLKLIRYNAHNYNDAVGTLTVGAVKL